MIQYGSPKKRIKQVRRSIWLSLPSKLALCNHFPDFVLDHIRKIQNYSSLKIQISNVLQRQDILIFTIACIRIFLVTISAFLPTYLD